MAKDTRDRILQAAAAALLAHGPDATIDDIRTLAGVSNGAFFHTFKRHGGLKEALRVTLLAARHMAVMAVFQEAGRSAEEVVAAAIGAYLEWAEEAQHARVLAMLPIPLAGTATAPHDGVALLRDEIAAIGAWAAPLIARGAIRDLPDAVLHALLFGPAELVVQQWCAGVLDAPLEACVPALAKAAWLTMEARPLIAGGAAAGRAVARKAQAAPQGVLQL